MDEERRAKGPAAANGIAALKPTHGLLSRDGIIPLALSLDTGGPMARNVYDLALALGLMTGVDDADPATQQSKGKFQSDYTKYLEPAALNGARIGVARDFMGADADVDWVVQASLDAMRRAGATIVDVRCPKWLLDVKDEFFNAIQLPEFGPQIASYLATLAPDYPKSLAELIERSLRYPSTSPAAGSATNIANLAGLPDLSVPAGFTGDGLPVDPSFLGPAFSEQKLLSLVQRSSGPTYGGRMRVFLTMPDGANRMTNSALAAAASGADFSR